jgi:hypothetical protein
MGTVSSKFYSVDETMFMLHGAKRVRHNVQDLGMTNLVSWSWRMKEGELTIGANSAIGSGQRGVGKQVVMYSCAIAKDSTMEKWVH